MPVTRTRTTSSLLRELNSDTSELLESMGVTRSTLPTTPSNKRQTYYAKPVLELIHSLQAAGVLDAKVESGLMALKKLAHYKSQLRVASVSEASNSLQLESKLCHGLPSLSKCKSTLKLFRTNEEQASQDWAFLLMMLDLHEALCQAQGNSEIQRIKRKVLPLRLKIYKKMPEQLFKETEKIGRQIDQDVGFFSHLLNWPTDLCSIDGFE